MSVFDRITVFLRLSPRLNHIHTLYVTIFSSVNLLSLELLCRPDEKESWFLKKGFILVFWSRIRSSSRVDVCVCISQVLYNDYIHIGPGAILFLAPTWNLSKGRFHSHSGYIHTIYFWISFWLFELNFWIFLKDVISNLWHICSWHVIKWKVCIQFTYLNAFR